MNNMYSWHRKLYRLVCLFPTPQGKPKPAVSWLKDGQPVDTKRVSIRNSDKDSIMFVRTAERADSGVYEITVKVDSFEDKATITLQIVGEPHTHTLKRHTWMHMRVCDRCESGLISDLPVESAQMVVQLA